MKLQDIKLQDIIAQVVGWITQAVSIALLLAICGAVAGIYGFRAPILPRIEPQALAWLCGAWWLWRGGKL